MCKTGMCTGAEVRRPLETAESSRAGRGLANTQRHRSADAAFHELSRHPSRVTVGCPALNKYLKKKQEKLADTVKYPLPFPTIFAGENKWGCYATIGAANMFWPFLPRNYTLNLH